MKAKTGETRGLLDAGEDGEKFAFGWIETSAAARRGDTLVAR